MKKRVIVLFSVVPFLLGFAFAYLHHHSLIKANTTFSTNAIEKTDKIVLSSQGNIYTLTQDGAIQITQGQQITEPIAFGDTFLAVGKKTNYSSLLEFSAKSAQAKTVLGGNSSKIDTMSWFTDPAYSPNSNLLAFVSDKDKALTNIPDNALFIHNTHNGKTTMLVKPYPYSGGVANPVWDPANSDILLYTYYEYDPKTLNPYSVIEEYNFTTGETTDLTTEKENALQAAFSPDGTHLLFIGRNADGYTVNMYLTDFSDGQVDNTQNIASGDYAYPKFSFTNGYIYFLQAQGDAGYNLMTAQVKQNTLTNIREVTSGDQLLGNSSFDVVHE